MIVLKIKYQRKIMSYESLDNFETKLYIEELLEQDVKEIFGICATCNGTRQTLDIGPHNNKSEPCDNCKDGILERD